MDEGRRNKSNNYCCVPQCSSYYSGDISFHKFPTTDKKLHKNWIAALKIGKRVTPHMRICSKHFREEDFFFNRNYATRNYRLKKNAVPSQNLPKLSNARKVDQQRIEQRKLRFESRQQLREVNRACTNIATPVQEEVISFYTEKEKDVAQTLINFGDIETTRNEAKSVIPKTFEDKAVQVNTFEEFQEFDISNIINTDYRLRIFTGINNLALLSVLMQALMSILDTSKSKLTVKKMILLTLMRIKLDVPFTVLSIFFNVSASTAQTCFQKSVRKLSYLLQCVIRFPEKDEILRNMPTCFKKFPDTRIVLDCTEIEVQKSKCLKCKIGTYSFYKGRHTTKFLIGAAPSGLITFVSKPYGGRASDKAIFNKENLVEKLMPFDAVMVDKGFLIDRECADKQIRLIRPPFLKKKKQFSKAEALQTAEIARARVHVERVIQRIKNFRVFRNVLPWKFVRYAKNIMTIIVALTNLSNPILSQDKF